VPTQEWLFGTSRLCSLQWILFGSPTVDNLWFMDSGIIFESMAVENLLFLQVIKIRQKYSETCKQFQVTVHQILSSILRSDPDNKNRQNILKNK